MSSLGGQKVGQFGVKGEPISLSLPHCIGSITSIIIKSLMTFVPYYVGVLKEKSKI